MFFCFKDNQKLPGIKRFEIFYLIWLIVSVKRFLSKLNACNQHYKSSFIAYFQAI